MYKRTISKKIFLSHFLLTMILLVIISLLVYFIFFNALRSSETNNAIQASDKAKQSIEFALNLINNTATMLGGNKELLTELEKDKRTSFSEYVVGQNKMSTMLQNVISVQEYIKGIYVISPKGNFYTSNWGVDENEVFDIYKDQLHLGNEIKEHFTGTHSVSYYSAYRYWVISYVRPIFDPDSGKVLGIVIMDIDYDLLKESVTISSIQNDEKVLIVASNGETIITYPYNVILDDVVVENPELLKKEKLQINRKVFGNDSTIVSNTINHTDWKIIRIISSNKIHGYTRTLETVAIYVIVIFIFIALVTSIALASTITKPIKELNKKFKLVEQGDLSANITIKSKDELGELGNSFNIMVKKLEELINKLLDEQQKKSNMEFDILQAQINPHFLYNTLDSIKWLAVIQNINTISDMTTALINLLKYNISKGSVSVTLSQELESIKNYVKIQKYRYGDSFNVEFNAQEETKECKILRFILQPIVENSIIHGFENAENKGIIAITSRIENDKLIIEVIDNGVGMDGHTLDRIFKTEDFKKKFNGIGVQNIQDRIKAYFGSEYGLSFESKPEQGTKAILTLPYNK